MARRRQERKEERQTFGRGGSATRYKMRERMVSIGDDYWIDDEHGRKVFKVDGKALRVRDTLNFEDAHRNVLCKIQERMLRVKDTMEVEDANGKQVATVKKAIISPVRDRFTVKVKDGPDLNVKGNIVDHEYTIGEGHNKVAQVSKKWFRVRDSYGVQVDPDQDDIVILAVTVCIDQMAHN